MAVTEKQMRRLVVDMLHPLAAFPLENMIGAGMADVACTLGWIELKVGNRPAKLDTNVTFTMRPAQRVWHREWRRKGGKSWTLSYLHERGDRHNLWMLHDGAWSADCMDMVDEVTLVGRAIGTAIDMRPADLIKWLLMPTIYVKD